MGWLRDFLLEQNTPRWQLIVGGFIVLAWGLIQSEIYYQRALEASAADAARVRIEATINEVQKNSIDFQTYANAYVTSVLEKSPDLAERRSILIANILAQDASVDVSTSLFNGDLVTEVAEYRASLRSMKEAVEQVSDVVSMGPFWKAASDLLVARNKLLRAMERIDPPGA